MHHIMLHRNDRDEVRVPSGTKHSARLVFCNHLILCAVTIHRLTSEPICPTLNQGVFSVSRSSAFANHFAARPSRACRSRSREFENSWCPIGTRQNESTRSWKVLGNS
jgi:hypothetical protein